MRPILRPGTHVLRRSSGELQVGLDPRHAVVLPDDPDTRSCLALLGRCADEQEYGAARTLGELDAQGLLLDGDTLIPLIPWHRPRPTGTEPGTPAAPRQEVAAIARRSGDRCASLLEARARCRVDVETFADTPDGLLTAEMVRALDRAGVAASKAGPADRTRRRDGVADRLRRRNGAGPAQSTKVVALLGVGEPQRERTDAWMRAGTPHLLVRLTEGSAVLGPFVVPGRTACLRCLDAHHTDVDASWPLLVRQYATASATDRADGVPEPVDSLLAGLALAWAGRDLASYAEGSRPSTWSTTIRLDAELTSIETRSWLRHPECGCGWA